MDEHDVCKMFGDMNQWLHEQLAAVRLLPSTQPRGYHLSVNGKATHGTLRRLLEEIKSRMEGEESWLNLEYKGGANGSSATDYESCITGVLNQPPPPPAMAPHDDQREDEERDEEESEVTNEDHNDVCGW